MAAIESSQSLSTTLLGWYDDNARPLPWRAPTGEAPMDAYRVWLSEIMLQQTTVAAVRPFFERFTARWPNVAALAAADEAEIMAAWAGLGYYARARNLHACARTIASDHACHFPRSEESLRALPGIGAYTAAAIAAIAFGAPATVVDANVERVVTRLFAIATPLPQARAAIRACATQITPSERVGDFAQAMMDLGATICTPRDPDCGLCPLRKLCRAARTADPGAFPIKPAKIVKPHRRATAFWIEADGDVLLIRRPSKGMLGGMRALPTGPWQVERPGLAEAPVVAEWRRLGTVRHVFTHFSLDLMVEAVSLSAQPKLAGEWWPIDDIEQAGLPTLFAKAAVFGRAASEAR